MLFLGHVVCEADCQQEQQQQQEGPLLLSDEAAVLSLSAPADGVAAYSNGVWHLECRGVGASTDPPSSSSSGHGSMDSSCSNGELLLEYNDTQSMNTAVEGGVLGATLQSAFSQAVIATSQPAAAAAGAGAHGASLTPQCIVATWGEEVQLQLFASEGHGSAEQQGHVGSIKAASDDDLGSSSSNSRGRAVRVAVVQGSCIFMDKQVQLQPVGAAGTAMGLRLAMASISSGSSGHRVAVLPLFIFPSDGNPSSIKGGCVDPWAPLARATLLLLPVGAAAEIKGWLQQQQLSQHQVAPLLLDLALLLSSRCPQQEVSSEDWGGSAAAACLAELSEDSSHGVTLGLGLMTLLGQGLLPYLHAYGWEACAALAAARMGELFEALQREGPAAVLGAAGQDTGVGEAAAMQVAWEAEEGRDAEISVNGNTVWRAGTCTGFGGDLEAATQSANQDKKVGAGGSGLCEVAAAIAMPGRLAGIEKGLGHAIAAVEQWVRKGAPGSSGSGMMALEKKDSCSLSPSLYRSSSKNSLKSSSRSESSALASSAAEHSVINAADVAAATGWGPRALWLCCRGFKGGVETAYLGFKAKQFELSERVLLLVQLLAAMGFWCRCYLAIPGWSPGLFISIGKPMAVESAE